MLPTPRSRRSVPVALGRAAVIAVLAALVVSACGGTDEGEEPAAPLIIEPGPAQVSERLDLDIPLHSTTGFFLFHQWPPACDLLSDAEITTVLPQVRRIERTSIDEEMTIMDTGQDFTARNATCRYELDIPQAGLGMELMNPPVIEVRIDAAGTPEVARLNFLEDMNPPVQVPSGQCHVVGERLAGVACLKGPLTFKVTSDFTHQQIGDDTWTDRYRVGGETRTFTGEIGAEDPGAFREVETFRRDALDVELAKVILAKF
jgi:hypothetical protein